MQGIARSHTRAWELQVACLALVLTLLGALARTGDDVSQEVLGASGALILAGLSLDLYGRIAGALVARDEEHGAGWVAACALGGSPLLALHALRRQEGPLELYPGPLGALVAISATLVVLFALVAGRLGG